MHALRPTTYRPGTAHLHCCLLRLLGTLASGGPDAAFSSSVAAPPRLRRRLRAQHGGPPAAHAASCLHCCLLGTLASGILASTAAALRPHTILQRMQGRRSMGGGGAARQRSTWSTAASQACSKAQACRQLATKSMRPCPAPIIACPSACALVLLPPGPHCATPPCPLPAHPHLPHHHCRRAYQPAVVT